MRLRVKIVRLAAMVVLLIAGGVTAALADSGNGNGPPASPPGQGECEHGNSGQACKPDPQPDHGKDCDEHGKQGGVNEDHCLGTSPTTTTNETTTNETTTQETTTDQTTTRETSTTPATKETTTTSTTTTAQGPGPTATAGPSGGPRTASSPPVAKPKQAVKARAVSPAHTKVAQLPFTGFPAWVLAIVGSVLLVAGLGIRRIAD
jgi:hypothetical protein